MDVIPITWSFWLTKKIELIECLRCNCQWFYLIKVYGFPGMPKVVVILPRQPTFWKRPGPLERRKAISGLTLLWPLIRRRKVDGDT